MVIICNIWLFEEFDIITGDCYTLGRAYDRHRIAVDVAYINIGWTYKAAFDLAAQRVGIGPNIYPSCLPTWENVLGRRGIRKYSS